MIKLDIHSPGTHSESQPNTNAHSTYLPRIITFIWSETDQSAITQLIERACDLFAEMVVG